MTNATHVKLKSSSKVFLVIALGLISVALLAAVITLSILLADANTKPTNTTCFSKSCIKAANNILSNIDERVDPCEDFNEFSCGSFIRNKRIPDDATSEDTFSALRINLANQVADALERPINNKEDISATENAKLFYQSCLNETEIELNGLDTFRSVLLNELGGWPIISQVFDLQRDPMDLMLAFFKLNSRPIFYIGMDTNPKDPDYFNLEAGQAGWFFDRKYYNTTDNPTNVKILAAYKVYMSKVIKGMHLKLDDETLVDTKIEEMYQLELKFSNYLYDTAEKRAQQYTNTTLKNLTDTTSFDFTKFVKDYLLKEFTNLTITESEPILVNEYKYLVNATALYKDSLANNKETLINLMIWSFVNSRSNYLPKLFRDARLEFDKVYTGTNAAAARSRLCANAAIDRMPYAVGRLYLKESGFDDNSKQSVVDMVDNILNEFKLILTNVDWMDSESKEKAMEKANNIDVKMAYPEFTYNDTYLNKLYANYKFDAKNYIANSLIVLKSDFKEKFNKLREKNDRKEWISGPAIVNAFYSPPANQICFPAGILQAPFFDSQSPKYLNYGGIGSVIGHEITHGFDDQGRTYDKDGKFFRDDEVGLWTNATVEQYKQRASCIINQYSSYNATQVNMNLNGYQTQGENIADNGGIKESFGAYQKWAKQNGPEQLLPGLEKYSQTQLFFINYAQVWCAKFRDASLKSRILTGVHSPGPFRIQGPTSNFVEFSKAFNCKPKQANNPDNKCSVW